MHAMNDPPETSLHAHALIERGLDGRDQRSPCVAQQVEQLAERDEPTDLADALLHARAARGEVEAMESVWMRNRRWIASVLAAHAPRGADIEDLLQEVAATFVAKAREIRDAASVRGWLRVVAVNEARMAARDRGIERRSLASFAQSWRGTRRDHDAAADARETLHLLSQLPAQYAEPLLLQAGQGLSQREIAEILDVPETTVETRLVRARRLLRQLAAEEEGLTKFATQAGAKAVGGHESVETKQQTEPSVRGSSRR